MMDILIPVLLVVAMGFVLAVILTIASKIFFVPVDETVTNLRAELPGANCGACGFAGCDDYAAALAADHEIGTAKCPVGGAAVAAKLAEILGVEAGSAEPQVAVVMCNGNAQVDVGVLLVRVLRVAHQVGILLTDCNKGRAVVGEFVEAGALGRSGNGSGFFRGIDD